MEVKRAFVVVSSCSVLLLIYAIFSWLPDNPGARPQATSEVAEGAHKAKGDVSSRDGDLADRATAPLVSRDSNPGISPFVETYRDFVRSSDLRIFVEAAKQRPERGGLAYAQAALEECWSLRQHVLSSEASSKTRADLIGATKRVDVERLTTLDQLQSRCAGFSDAELEVDNQAHILKWGKEKDPILILRGRVRSLDRSDDRAKAGLLDEVLASGDPVTLRWIKGFSKTSASSGSDESVGYYDGKKFGGLDFLGYEYAWDLAICGVSDTCRDLTSRSKAECVIGGECYPDERAYILAKAASDEQRSKIIVLSEKISKSLSQKDPRPFLAKTETREN